MGVLSTNRSQITAGGLISASFVSDLYNVFTGNVSESVSISGSLSVTGSIIGNLNGVATIASESVIKIASSGDTQSFAVATVPSTISTSSGNPAQITVHQFKPLTYSPTTSTLLTTASNAFFALTASNVSGSGDVFAKSGSFNRVAVSDNFVSDGGIFLGNLPTTDPLVQNQLWRSGSYLMVSLG
jgi:hypothetical protein